jgi:hypothetical protein
VPNVSHLNFAAGQTIANLVHPVTSHARALPTRRSNLVELVHVVYSDLSLFIADRRHVNSILR